MISLIGKYCFIIAGLTLFFTNFIACGVGMYSKSLRHDMNQDALPAYTNDPDSEFYAIHAIDGWTRIPVRYTFDASQNALQRAAIERAMETWEIATGQDLFEFVDTSSKTGSDFKTLKASLGDQENGQYNDEHWAYTEKDVEVLATTIWNLEYGGSAIQEADIRYNSESYLFWDAYDYEKEVDEGKEFVDLETLALHELGHLLGLGHVEEEHKDRIDPHSVMRTTVLIGGWGLENRIPTQGDVERIQKIYGCEGDACDLDLVMETLEQRHLNPEPYLENSGEDVTVVSKDY